MVLEECEEGFRLIVEVVERLDEEARVGVASLLFLLSLLSFFHPMSCSFLSFASRNWRRRDLLYRFGVGRRIDGQILFLPPHCFPFVSGRSRLPFPFSPPSSPPHWTPQSSTRIPPTVEEEYGRMRNEPEEEGRGDGSGWGKPSSVSRTVSMILTLLASL